MLDIKDRVIEEMFDREAVTDEEFIDRFFVEEIITRPKSEARRAGGHGTWNQNMIIWFTEAYPSISDSNKIEDFSIIEEIAFRYLEGNKRTFQDDVKVSYVFNESTGTDENPESRERTVKINITDTPIHEIMMSIAGSPDSFEEACRIIIQKGQEREASATVQEMTGRVRAEVDAAE
jgi:hypothetical protein